ncbi:molybdate ABC transporter permease subunit [Photobacterium sp. ZSDE20]|uniref:Molybdenum transport system permease n=1 Tax=Photobacterium pectinilyticum TaxID=2906793 RepID=A0ABT1N1G7_9GAMM|nr:molybdate ABC transporter permease subunit [Photobacterium sp. ZSDE20]MCQ1058580.1 molybdate ABC transporter permease subunit [Photobacterium sp. ZSDE20]MDD1826299.1 molybdate ABC transporter permease subunit [Photobacterium sp. ZSDE20]
MDWTVVTLTLRLALTVTLVLLLIATPIAWWLSQTASRWKGLISAVCTMPMVLPPTVLGFYLLVLMGPHGPLGSLFNAMGIPRLPFSFMGIVIACTVHSLPFVVQPLENSFKAIGKAPLEAAATLRCPPYKVFLEVALPLAWPGILSAAIMGFCHTLGEFGVVLMVGGNIPGQTRVLSVAIYSHVEAMEYAQAHMLAGGLVIISLLALLMIHAIQGYGAFLRQESA